MPDIGEIIERDRICIFYIGSAQTECGSYGPLIQAPQGAWSRASHYRPIYSSETCIYGRLGCPQGKGNKLRDGESLLLCVQCTS